MEPVAAASADLFAAVAALAQAAERPFDPQRFLDPLSTRIQTRIPHRRAVILRLSEDAKTFTIFAEHAPPGTSAHDGFWTTAFDPRARFQVAGTVTEAAFRGASLRADDLENDPRLAKVPPEELRAARVSGRSAIVVPLPWCGQVVGALAFTHGDPNQYGEGHLELARQVAQLIAPFVQNSYLRERERRRRERMAAVHGVAQQLASSLDVKQVFGRLADGIRPVVDFDLIGIGLFKPTRELELLVEVRTESDPNVQRETPRRQLTPDQVSFSARVDAGETVLIGDAPAELDRSKLGDGALIETGCRAAIVTPLLFGETVGGSLYFAKKQPYWFDSTDVEIAQEIGVHVVVALQHQRLAEEQRRLVESQLREKTLEKRVEVLENQLGERFGFDRILGRARPLHEVLERAAKVAATETTVLITGESGTGKELVARAVHAASPRRDGPFIAINCAALPESLLESELFGHEKGAFTGAEKLRPGRFELAAGGSLLLDEVAELAPTVQAKLLRILQERQFERVGGTKTLAADVRLIAATNRDLAAEVERGRFRADLYYRLDVFTLRLPPLRERGDDVLLLAEHFVRELEKRMGKSAPGLSREARDALLAHRWPGNIRELQNAIERAMIVSEGGLVTSEQLGLAPRQRPPMPLSSQAPPPGERAAESVAGAARGAPSSERLEDVERRLVEDALAKAAGNKSRAAELLGVTRSQLYTRMKKFGIRE